MARTLYVRVAQRQEGMEQKPIYHERFCSQGTSRDGPLVPSEPRRSSVWATPSPTIVPRHEANIQFCNSFFRRGDVGRTAEFSLLHGLGWKYATVFASKSISPPRGRFDQYPGDIGPSLSKDIPKAVHVPFHSTDVEALTFNPGR